MSAAVAPPKWCSKCDRTKRADEFANSSGTRDGKQYWCRECKADLPPSVPVELEVLPPEQVCGKCRELLPAGDFAFKSRKNRWLGFQPWCKNCKRTYRTRRKTGVALGRIERRQREAEKQEQYEQEKFDKPTDE